MDLGGQFAWIFQLNKLEEYNPLGYKNGESQLLAKNIFLFQYYTGGIRIQDALTLTNKEIKSEGFQIRIKKTHQVEVFPFCYEQLLCLKHYYLQEFQSVIENVKLGGINLSATTIIDLNRLEGLGDFNNLGLEQLEDIKRKLIKHSKKQTELVQFIPPIDEVIDLLKDEITLQFFNKVKNRPQSFLFPKLKWGDFKDVFGNSNNVYLSSKQAYIIHKASTSHNSNLKRISQKLGFDNIAGHTPRHTIANHLYNDDYSVEEIQKVLVHADPKTTEIYLNERHGSPIANKTIREAHLKRRQLKRQNNNRGF